MENELAELVQQLIYALTGDYCYSHAEADKYYYSTPKEK